MVSDGGEPPSVASLFTMDVSPLIGLAFSPGGDVLAASDTSGYAYLWPTKWLNP